MPFAPVIRTASRADAPVLQLMLEALATETGAPGAFGGTLADLLEHGFGAHPRFSACIASVDGLDAGMALCFPEYSSWRGRAGIYVQDLYVAPAHRGAGIARTLLAHCAREAAYLRLSVARDNEAGAAFYSACGFAEARDERIFVIEGQALAELPQR